MIGAYSFYTTNNTISFTTGVNSNPPRKLLCATIPILKRKAIQEGLSKSLMSTNKSFENFSIKDTDSTLFKKCVRTKL